MKKIMLSLALALLLFAANTYAAAGNISSATTTAETGKPAVPTAINAEFTRHFGWAKDAKWELTNNAYKVTFRMKGKEFYAFYANNADFMGIATNLPSDQLPQDLRTELKTNYANYWITDLFAFHAGEDMGFTVTLENADRTVVLKSVDGGSWNVFHTTQKS